MEMKCKYESGRGGMMDMRFLFVGDGDGIDEALTTADILFIYL